MIKSEFLKIHTIVLFILLLQLQEIFKMLNRFHILFILEVVSLKN